MVDELARGKDIHRVYAGGCLCGVWCVVPIEIGKGNYKAHRYNTLIIYS